MQNATLRGLLSVSGVVSPLVEGYSNNQLAEYEYRAEMFSVLCMSWLIDGLQIPETEFNRDSVEPNINNAFRLLAMCHSIKYSSPYALSYQAILLVLASLGVMDDSGIDALNHWQMVDRAEAVIGLL